VLINEAFSKCICILKNPQLILIYHTVPHMRIFTLRGNKYAGITGVTSHPVGRRLDGRFQLAG